MHDVHVVSITVCQINCLSLHMLGGYSRSSPRFVNRAKNLGKLSTSRHMKHEGQLPYPYSIPSTHAHIGRALAV